jgi:hypothetical protein
MIYIEQMKFPSSRQQYCAMGYESSRSICRPLDPFPLNPELIEQEYQRRTFIPSQEEAAQFSEVHRVSPTLKARERTTFLVPDPDILSNERTGLYDLNCDTKQRISAPDCCNPLAPRPIHPDLEWCSGFYATHDVIEGPTSDDIFPNNSETVTNHGATSSGVSDIIFENIHVVDDSSHIDEQQGTVLARRLSFDTSMASTSREEHQEKGARSPQGLLLLNSTDAVFDRLRRLMKRSVESQKQLQEWDMRNGLPKSHSPVMVNTSRSRKQLQTGKILAKWDGSPLIKKNSQGSKIGKPRPRRKLN